MPNFIERDGHMNWCERNCDCTFDGENGCVAFARAHGQLEDQ